MEAGGDVLGRRDLNRATLERQMLLRRSTASGTEAVEHLIGLQAQAPGPPYVGLWTRLEAFDPEKLSRMILERRAVRIALMRNTVHLVTSRDALWLRPLVEPVILRGLHASRADRARMEGVDVGELADRGREILEEEPRTARELGPLLTERWPGHDPALLARAIRHVLPLVQVPPRGLWGRSGQTTHTTLEAWLGREPDPNPSLADLILRYLGAFGPASVMDAQTWSGLTRLGEVFEGLRPRLRVFRDEGGRELFDLPDAPRPGGDVPAPPRLLPAFDNAILSHADRTRLIAPEHRAVLASRNGMVPAVVLLDGFVRGTWKTEKRGGRARVEVAPFRRFSKGERDVLAEEAERAVRFVEGDAGEYEVTFVS